ncbi:TPA: hypothetical protein NPR04_002457 [Acinetobacter baumannii]|uniref:hypothetical protein n=1 Tax=Acinetobacter pittii TaxID=48296 RepID=UPI003AA8ADDE|nr:hypothetical protein [Acinetobacter baumannii]HCJ1341081.1 hypothetical protein [Acinetobacter baumannii]
MEFLYTPDKKERTEQKDDAVIGKLLPTEDDTKPLPNKNTKKIPTAQVIKRTFKKISITPTSRKSGCMLE